MHRNIKAMWAVVAVLLIAACTDNYRAKNMGGTMKVELPAGQRLVTVTWKEQELWYLTRPRTAEEQPVTWTFKEKSDLGIQEGTVILQEK